MAIERVAQNVDFGSAPQVGSVPMNVQNKSPDVNKFADNNQIQMPENSLLDNLVHAALPAVTQMANKELSNAREEAYLKGQSAAGAGLAQDQVDSNIFTKDWATAGYRDTRGRLAQADAEAQTTVDMEKLKEQSPEQFQQYLAQRRAQLMPSLEGMSLDARKAFMAQQLTSDRAAIAKQAGLHQKFIVDQMNTSLSTGFSVQLDALGASRTDSAAYLTQADNAYSNLYGNVWINPNLPKADKLKLVENGAQLALSQNHQVLYEKMRDYKIPGTDHSMLDELPMDAQVKLSTAYKTSMTDTANMRLGQFASQWGLMQSSFGDPLQPPMSYKDFSAMRDQAVQNGFLKTPESIASAEKAWADGNQKKLAQGNLARDFATGNVQGIFAAGKTESDGYTAFIQTNARNGVSIADTTAQLLQIGVHSGFSSAFKGVGELTKSAVAMIGTQENIDPGQLQMLNTVLSTLDQAQAQGHTTAMGSYLASFGDPDRAKILVYREELQRTGNPTVAATNAAATMANASQLTETERNVQAAHKATENQKLVDALAPNSLWSDFKGAVVPDFLRSNSALNQSKISASGSFFESPERVATAMAASKTAFQEELNYITRAHPELDANARNTMALTATADRTLVTQGGPLVVPHLMPGQSIQEFFGVNKNIRPDVVAAGIDDLHTPAKGNRTIYKIDGQGRLQWQELSKDGAFVRGGAADPKDVAASVQDKQDAISEKFQATDGAGVSVKGASGVSVQFNGNNTAGVQNTDMLEFRKALVKHEDVRDTPYTDLSGKVVDGKPVQTVGVGISSHNPHFPKAEAAAGKLEQQVINDTFIRASNDAAVAARGGQDRLGLRNGSSFKLLAEMSYQGGGKFYNVAANKPYVQALAERNVDAALTALKDTVPYKMSGAERQKYYEDLTRKALASPT